MIERCLCDKPVAHQNLANRRGGLHMRLQEQAGVKLLAGDQPLGDQEPADQWNWAKLVKHRVVIQLLLIELSKLGDRQKE